MGKVVDYIDSLPFEDEYYAIFGKRLNGSKMFCPFHANTNTPAAKFYPKSNQCVCFVCGRGYGTYDLLKKYNPERIDELKGSIVMNVGEVSRPIKESIFVSIDGLTDMGVIIKKIVDETGV